jgi:ribosome-binding factor A
MSESNRMERVSRQLRSALTDVLQEGLRDPRVGAVTLTEVRVSPDLRHANIQFVPLGGVGDGARIAEGLNAAKGYLQRKVSRMVRFKYLPVLHFHVDEGLAKVYAVTEMLNELAAEREE